MKRIISMFTVAAFMVAVVAASALPASAALNVCNADPEDGGPPASCDPGGGGGGGDSGYGGYDPGADSGGYTGADGSTGYDPGTGYSPATGDGYQGAADGPVQSEGLGWALGAVTGGIYAAGAGDTLGQFVAGEVANWALDQSTE